MSELALAELLAKVRRVRILASRAVNDLFAGEYHSAFRGRGMEFDEVREYQPGDEVRTIDWNVTARQGAPFVKRYREERELTVLLAVDVSASHVFGSSERSKGELLTEIAALLMFSALKNNDKVGLVLFDSEVRLYLPPRKGKGSILRLLRELVAVSPRRAPTDLVGTLEFIGKVQRRRAVVFLLSDLVGQETAESEKALRLMAARHDLVAITAEDPREIRLPAAGLVEFEDAETGGRRLVDLGSARVRAEFERRAEQREARIVAMLRRAGIDRLRLTTDGDYTLALHRFFRMRERRLSR
jgi:uncharacterized protein (DUF58 family)